MLDDGSTCTPAEKRLVIPQINEAFAFRLGRTLQPLSVIVRGIRECMAYGGRQGPRRTSHALCGAHSWRPCFGPFVGRLLLLGVIVILTCLLAVGVVMIMVMVVRQFANVLGPFNGDLHAAVQCFQIGQRSLGGREL
jgi:hypothetical protein